jgi:hypothetical protein
MRRYGILKPRNHYLLPVIFGGAWRTHAIADLDLPLQTSTCENTSKFRCFLLCPSLPTTDNPAFYGIIYDEHGVVLGTTGIA